ncbi:MAG: alginate export family protein [Bryobacteraceae bacterium]|nr:alginate export family protein [Bryobacteraceae bacterium]
MRRYLIFLLMASAGFAQRSYEWGFEQRVRNENWDNLFDWNESLDDQRVQLRYRTRLWGKAPLSETVDLFVGVDQETCHVLVQRQPLHLDEVAFESAYVDFKKVFVKGLSLRVGRQNITKGEGFLLFEGNPWDGSRTIYHNAAVLGYSWKKSKLEFLGISNPKHDLYLPKFHNRHRLLVEWDELAGGVYYTDSNRANLSWESYYLYKTETRDYRSPSNPQYQPDKRFSTAGARAVRQLGHGWSLTGEWAGQWGHQRPGIPVRGWGGYAYAKKVLPARGKPSFSGGWWGFSGDDPKTTGRVEGWDAMFGRWPKWSELYIYSLFREKGVAYWTNLSMWQGEFLYAPWKPVALRATYYRMGSFQPFAGDRRIFGDGTFRGNMYQVRGDFLFNRNLRGHALWEHVQPGSFYRERSPAYFLRFELIYAFQQSHEL